MKKLFTYLLAFVLALSFSTASLYAQSISELERKQRDIENSSDELREQLDSTKEEKSAVRLEVEAIDAQLQQVVTELEHVNEELDKTEGLLEQTSLDLSIAEAERVKQNELLKSRLRVMYEHGYGDGYLTNIMKAENLSDLFNRIEYMNRIATYDKNLIKEMRETEALIAAKYQETEQYKNELTVLADEQTEKKHSLDVVISEKTQRLATLDADEQTYLQKISDLEKADREIENLIRRAEEEAARRAAENQRTSGGGSGGSSAPPPVYKGGRFNWPIPASSRITSNYGWRTSPKREFHTGVDVGVATGNDILAAEAGVVVSSGNINGYGLTVIINHGGGLSTLYAHNSKLLVSPGQSVQKGEVIAKSGNTGYSTGPHSHFEVRINGTHTSPNDYLGI